MGILFNMLCIGVLSFIGLWLLGLPLVLAQSALEGAIAGIEQFGLTGRDTGYPHRFPRAVAGPSNNQ